MIILYCLGSNLSSIWSICQLNILNCHVSPGEQKIRLESFLDAASPENSGTFCFWKDSDLSRLVLVVASLGEMARLRPAWREWWFLLLFLHTWALVLAWWGSSHLCLARCSPGEPAWSLLSSFVFQSWFIMEIPAQ